MSLSVKSTMVWLACVLSLLLSACNDSSTGSATIEVRLTDAPGEYQEVNIDIQDLQVNADNGDSDQGWTSLPIKKGVYNLLDLTNGLDTLLGSTTLPAGKISQVRLILGDNNSIKTNDLVTPLNTPSAQQSGLKVKIDMELKEGITYQIVLDFDAARSIVATGSGKFNLKPVIRAFTTAEDGAIKGVVMPLNTKPIVYAISGTDTTSTYTNESGNFLVRGLMPATYRLVLVSTDSIVVEKPNVIVTTGEVTDVGTINF
jgi:hypothetical protein